MNLEFSCQLLWDDGEFDSWSARITRLEPHPSFWEFYIESRSGILVLAGQYSYGRFVCLPDFHIACPVSFWDDLSYNRDRLSAALLNPVDATTVACALKTLAKQEQLTF